MALHNFQERAPRIPRLRLGVEIVTRSRYISPNPSLSAVAASLKPNLRISATVKNKAMNSTAANLALSANVRAWNSEAQGVTVHDVNEAMNSDIKKYFPDHDCDREWLVGCQQCEHGREIADIETA